MPTVFDGPNLLITLDAPVGGLLTTDLIQDIYSDWKVWVKDSGGHLYEPAFAESVGGNPTTGSTTLGSVIFLRNDLGWRIQTTDADQEVSIVGDLYPQQGSLPMFMSRPGRTILITVDRSTNPRTIAVGSGVTQQDKDDIENQIFARVVETGFSFEALVRVMAAVAAGNITQQPDGAYVIRDINNTKDRIAGDDAANNGRTISSVDGA